MSILPRTFYNRATLNVAEELLGKKLVREYHGTLLTGIISETEAYLGENDSASHASRGQTPRNRIMYGAPGFAYVYFVYGMHYMLNVVTEPEGKAAAVLIRAIIPVDGIEIMKERRGRSGNDLANGPAKLCQTFAIDKKLNGWDLTLGQKLWIEEFKTIPKEYIKRGARVGIDYASPEHREAPWRFWFDEDFTELKER